MASNHFYYEVRLMTVFKKDFISFDGFYTASSANGFRMNIYLRVSPNWPVGSKLDVFRICECRWKAQQCDFILQILIKYSTLHLFLTNPLANLGGYIGIHLMKKVINIVA